MRQGEYVYEVARAVALAARELVRIDAVPPVSEAEIPAGGREQRSIAAEGQRERSRVPNLDCSVTTAGCNKVTLVE